MKRLQPARLEWHEGLPFNIDYGDVYFSATRSTAGAGQEVRHVFLEGNDLPARIKTAASLTIGETGFGTGLNFLMTLACWREHAPPAARLHYLSVEKHPLTRRDLERVVALWPDLAEEAQALLAVYPAPVAGTHRRALFGGRVSLTLLFGEAAARLANCEARVDAWYLDGFAPACNPNMWSQPVVDAVTRLTAAGGSFATFSVAGAVRRRLEAAGFRVEKRPGFGTKREMLCGRLATGSPGMVSPGSESKAPWYEFPRVSPPAQRRAMVIGAGVAGLAAAHALACRGWQVTVLEQAPAPATQASGNPAGILMPQLARDMNAAARVSLTAFDFTRHWLAALQQRHDQRFFEATGVLQLLAEPTRYADLPLPPEVVTPISKEVARDYAGVAVTRGGLWYPDAGWVDPRCLCETLLQDQAQRIVLQTGVKVTSLHYHAGDWIAADPDGELARAPVAIVANGQDAQRLLNDLAWDLQAVRGQLSYLDAGCDASGSGDGPALACPVCFDGYVTPPHNGCYCVGATFDPAASDPALSQRDHQANLTALRKAVPSLAARRLSGGRVAFRASTPDHLPLIGPVPDAEFYTAHYADLHHGRPAQRYPVAEYRPGLYVSCGHGSRGLVSGPLAGALIAAQLEAEPLPLDRTQLAVIHPARFLLRRFRRPLVQAKAERNLS